MAEQPFNTVDQSVRAALVKQVLREQDRAGYWRHHPEPTDSLTEARAAIVRYTALPDEGER